MFGDLRVPLVRHRDRADRAGGEGLPQLPDFRPLQLIHLVADLARRRGDRREQPDELGDPVPGGEPGNVRDPQAQLGGEPVQHVERALTPEFHRAERPAELDYLPAGPALPQPGQVPVKFGGPHRRLEAEGDRQAGLPVGPAAHGGVTVLRGEDERAVPHPGHIPFGEVADRPEGQREPGVGKVLHGRAVIHPLPRLDRQDLAQRLDQAHRRVAGQPGLLGHQVQVEPGHVRVSRDRLRGGRRYQAGLRLGPGQRGQDQQPRLSPALVREQGGGLRRAPQMTEDG